MCCKTHGEISGETQRGFPRKNTGKIPGKYGENPVVMVGIVL